MKKMLMWLACALLILAMPLSALAVVQPTDLFYVYDGANVLSDDTEATIVLNNDALYEACGAQIVIAAIESSGSMQLGDYAYTMFEEWGIGSADKNNGVLILMEIGAEDYWYVQGSGLERDLPTGDLAVLVDEYLEPDFARAKYDAGAQKLFEQLFERVADIYGVNVRYREYDAEDLYVQSAPGFAEETRTAQSRSDSRAALVIVAIVAVCIVLVVSRRGKKSRRSATVVVTPPPIVHVPPRPKVRVVVRRPSVVIRRPPPPRKRHHPGPFDGPASFGGPRPSGFSKPRSGGFGSPSRSSAPRTGGRSSFSGGGRSGGFGGGSRSGGGGGTRGGGGGRGR